MILLLYLIVQSICKKFQIQCHVRWCTKWRLSMKKSAVVHFRKKGHRSDFMFKLNKNILQYSEEYTYLGVIFQENINFHKNADTLSKAGVSIYPSTSVTVHEEFGRSLPHHRHCVNAV